MFFREKLCLWLVLLCFDWSSELFLNIPEAETWRIKTCTACPLEKLGRLLDTSPWTKREMMQSPIFVGLGRKILLPSSFMQIQVWWSHELLFRQRHLSQNPSFFSANTVLLSRSTEKSAFWSGRNQTCKVSTVPFNEFDVNWCRKINDPSKTGKLFS